MSSRKIITLKQVQKIVPRAVGSSTEKGLLFDEFDEDFKIEGKHYKYGLWTNDGDWFYAFNTLEKLKEQVNENI